MLLAKVFIGRLLGKLEGVSEFFARRRKGRFTGTGKRASTQPIEPA